MRLWSLHPKYLDRQGLVALWREGLLAQKVLAGKTKAYKSHPQLDRFYESSDPLAFIGAYLSHVVEEASGRNYHFDSTKIIRVPHRTYRIKVNRGQLKYEREHLLKKLKKRSPEIYRKWFRKKNYQVHPIFQLKAGGIEKWERL